MPEFQDIALRLLAYCADNQWAGYDPYDALNSKVFRALPFIKSRYARLALTQGMKRSPLNLRPLLLVPKTPNPKGLALFVSALVKLAKLNLLEKPALLEMAVDLLMDSRSKESIYSCWGYNFDWQSRTALVPKGTPNVICTSFAANALLDLYEFTRGAEYLSMAKSAAEFILKVLYREAPACYFAYTPMERPPVHNASLMGAALLSRVFKETGDVSWLKPALKAARYSVQKQHSNGSWAYGELDTQGWIDNFHTGFNLCALRRIAGYADTREFEASLQTGFTFYQSHFFENGCIPKYYHNNTYPIDIHSIAQSIITLVAFEDFGKQNISQAESILVWAVEHFWSPRNYFYFQKGRFFTNRIPYMRWSQAWMLLAIASLLETQVPHEIQKRTSTKIHSFS